MRKQNFYFLIIFSILLIPGLIFADGGMFVWPPEIHLEQSAQNAIVAWNGKEEIIVLSVDLESAKLSTALRILPLPSNPTEIKEGDFAIFEKLVEIMNKKIEIIQNEFLGAGNEKLAPPGIEITFHEKIGAHDLTIVKVNNSDSFLNWVKNFTKEKGLEAKGISSEFQEGIKNYLKRGIVYFVFDVIEAGIKKESVKPLIYRFNSDSLYFPVLISGVSEIGESQAKIRAFIVSNEEILDKGYWHPYWRGRFGFPVELSQEELKEVNEDIANLFDSSVKVTTFDYYDFLKEFKKDLVFYPQIWKKNLWIGNRGEDVRALQKILINEGLWDSDVEATGYFGSITTRALIKFQELNKSKVLEPLGLKNGTGFFGPKTREALNESITLPIEVKEDFCGWSTYGKCSLDLDCLIDGCSGQVCRSKFEGPTLTTCEWKECYDETKYGLTCKCLENKCQWAK